MSSLDDQTPRISVLPISAQSWRSHIHAHETVVARDFWYGNEGPWPCLERFSAERAAKDHEEILETLWRAAKSARKNGDLSSQRDYQQLANKLENCRRRDRCGSQACPMCARAFQRAKTAAQEQLLADLQGKRPNRRAVMVTIISDRWTFTPDQLSRFDIRKAQRWLKDVLTRVGVARVLVGGADLSWEGTFFQLHWHLAALTANRPALSKRLTRGFGKRTSELCPVQAKWANDLGFLAYANKTIKLSELLRHTRRELPELLLALDRSDPLDFSVLMRCRLGTDDGGLRLTVVKKK